MAATSTASSPNAKANAWDKVGGMFWTLGRKSARPTPSEITEFLVGVGPGSRVAVVGASTKELVEAALDRGAVVTVLDFSARMCADLQEALSGRSVTIRVFDITTQPASDLAARFDVVLSDRLINRFTREEAIMALTSMAMLCTPEGEIRASVKLGFYDMDYGMIAEGERRGILHTFYDPATKTINFAAAGDLLEEVVLPHGDIPRSVLLEWYRGRGRESRFDREDITELGREVSKIIPLTLARVSLLPDAPKTELVIFRRESV